MHALYGFQKLVQIDNLMHQRFFQNIATTQLNSTQSWVGFIYLRKPQNHKTTPHHKPQPQTKTVRPFFSAPTQYTTKLDQIQYATLFQPN